ncbi:MAG: phosphatase PAP2 family protein [Actinomycetes bacterium]
MLPATDGLFGEVNELARDTPWLHGPAAAFANFGIVLFALLLLAGWWFARGQSASTMAAALTAPLSTLVAVAANQPIISHVAEARPYAAHPHVLLLVGASADPSFPSDHATMAGAVAAGLWLVSWRLGVVTSALALLMAATRVYVGAHYPQDVVAGLALGAVVAVVVWLILRNPMTRLVESLRQTRFAGVLQA